MQVVESVQEAVDNFRSVTFRVRFLGNAIEELMRGKGNLIIWKVREGEGGGRCFVYYTYLSTTTISHDQKNLRISLKYIMQRYDIRVLQFPQQQKLAQQPAFSEDLVFHYTFDGEGFVGGFVGCGADEGGGTVADYFAEGVFVGD